MTDPQLNALLKLICRGDVEQVGVLADYMEEHTVDGAARVRKLWIKYQKACVWLRSTDLTRRKYTLWEGIARWRRWLRKQIAVEFNRKWKSRPLRFFA